MYGHHYQSPSGYQAYGWAEPPQYAFRPVALPPEPVLQPPPVDRSTPWPVVDRVPSSDSVGSGTVFPEPPSIGPEFPTEGPMRTPSDLKGVKTPTTYQKHDSFSSIDSADDIPQFAPVVIDTRRSDWRDRLRGLIDKLNGGSIYAFNVLQLPRERRVWWSPRLID